MAPEMHVSNVWRVLRQDGLPAVLRRTKPHLLHRWREFQGARLDRRLGIDTRGYAGDLESLGAIGQNVDHGNPYEPIQVGVFRRIVAALPVDLSRYQFVDLGCGKGRALVLAAEAGFSRMVGVEFATELAAECSRNIASYRSRHPGANPIDVRCEDAATFRIPPHDTVLFLYNPFDAAVMEKVIEGVGSGWRRHRFDLLIAYRNATEAGVLDAVPWLRPVAVERAFRVYRAVPE
jgi:SAM-dependent methyltransferase